MSIVADINAQNRDLSYIIPPVDRELLKKELAQDKFLRRTNYGDKEIYITTAHLSPNVMREIGRLRELSFALEGGGTGKEIDIDEFDTLPEPYCFKQLFVWSPADEEIVGGYRFIHGSNVFRTVDGNYLTPTAELFSFSQEFADEYLPYTIELGRSFVQPAFQPSTNLRKGMYSLDNLWDGLGALAMEIPETHYFFGKVTMYSHMNRKAKDLILYFLKKHFPDPDGLMWPTDELKIESDYNELVNLFNGHNYKDDYQILQREVRSLGANVPPLVNAYMSLSSTMRSFGTSYNHDFGETDETGILVTIKDIVPEKVNRHIDSYDMSNKRINRLQLFHVNEKRLPWWGKNSSNPAEMKELRMLKRLMENRRKAREERHAKKEARQVKRSKAKSRNNGN